MDLHEAGKAARPEQTAAAATANDTPATTPSDPTPSDPAVATRAAPAVTPTTRPSSAFQHRLKVAEWLTARGVAFKVKDQEKPDDPTTYLLDRCPIDKTHDAVVWIMQRPNGQLAAKCAHP